MSNFKEVAALDADTTISLGGVNKKTNKKNPVTVEGYLLGAKEVADAKKKSGISYLYILSTPEGNLGVWGKTNMDKKLKGVKPGTMVRITHTGFQATPNGEMYTYKVEQDSTNVIDVDGLEAPAAPSGYNDDSVIETALDEDPTPVDEVRPAYNSKPAAPAAQPPSAAKQAAVQALLNRGRKTA